MAGVGYTTLTPQQADARRVAGMLVDETCYTAEEITADSYGGHQWVSDLPAAMRP